MVFSDTTEHALITLYGDDADHRLQRAISSCLGKGARFLAPHDFETLEQAAQNSVLVFILLSSADDPNFKLGKRMKKNHRIVGDIIAFKVSDFDLPAIDIMGGGFDSCLSPSDLESAHMGDYIAYKTKAGARRLGMVIMEDEHHRVCDALSISPSSMLLFNAEKRAVFVSDHYFRAYPRIAPRLARGLNVYDAFELMMREDRISPEQDCFEALKKFWCTLEGTLEYQSRRGQVFRMRAVPLPNQRGTVVIGRNISEDQKKSSLMAGEVKKMRPALARLEGYAQNSSVERQVLGISLEDIGQSLDKIERYLGT